MNLQSTHHLKSGKIKKKLVKRSARGRENNLKAFLPALLLIGLLFAMAAMSVRLNGESESLTREASYLKRQIHRQNRYIANANIKIASLKGEVIFAQLKRFKLNLRNPTAGQIRRLRVSGVPRRERGGASIKEPRLLLSRR